MQSIQIKSPFGAFGNADIQVSPGADTGVGELELFAVVAVRTGAASVQVYMSVAALEELESMLALARSDIKKRIDVRAAQLAEAMA